jgi:hypothetical protein
MTVATHEAKRLYEPCILVQKYSFEYGIHTVTVTGGTPTQADTSFLEAKGTES